MLAQYCLNFVRYCESLEKIIMNLPETLPENIPTLTASVLQPHAEALVTVRRMVNHHNSNPHDHVFHELVYIESGTGEHVTVNGNRSLHAGDLIVIRPQIWHAYQNTKKLTLINCLFDDKLIRRFDDLLRSVPGSFDLFRKRSPKPRSDPPTVLRCPPAKRASLLNHLELIMTEHDNQTPGWQLAVTADLLDILLITARLWSQQDKGQPAALPPRAQRAVLDTALYLERNYTQAVDLDKLARQAHLSKYHLSRSFTQRMGMSIVQYTHRLRIEQACRQLRFTDLSITKIAADLGYNEIAYFTRCFSHQMGTSPSVYRSKQGAGSED